jgi:hypothetical protein
LPIHTFSDCLEAHATAVILVMADAFISYSRPDRALAMRLAERLRQRGVSVWWDVDLVGGERFRDAILDQLHQAQIVFVIWSAHSVASRFVLDEADYAVRRGKLVSVLPPAFAVDDLPLGFRSFQTLALDDEAGLDRALARRSGGRIIFSGLFKPASAQPAGPPTPPGPPLGLPHDEVAAYMQWLAAQSPSVVKREQEEDEKMKARPLAVVQVEAALLIAGSMLACIVLGVIALYNLSSWIFGPGHDGRDPFSPTAARITIVGGALIGMLLGIRNYRHQMARWRRVNGSGQQ